MKIAVIFTGGTIGSRAEFGVIRTSPDTKFELIERYRAAYDDAVQFLTSEPYRILSENLCAAHLEALAREVARVLDEQPDGVILTHGTDTIQYTAAFLQLLFADCGRPIVLVSSDYVLSDPRANGLRNFAAAVDFIRENLGTGVFVSFANDAASVEIHRGSRLQHPISYSAELRSILGDRYGVYTDGRFEKNPKYEGVDSFPEEAMGLDPRMVHLAKNSPVLRVHAYPGMSYPVIPEGTKAILFEGYHSGTLCIDEALGAFTDEAKKRGISLYLTGVTGGENVYETVEQYRQLGIESLIGEPAIATYMKLWLENSREG